MFTINKFIPAVAGMAMMTMMTIGAQAAVPAQPMNRAVTAENEYKTTTKESGIQTRAEEETWKDIGEGIWRDDTLLFNYMLSSVPEFAVKIQESEQTPGRYRIVNPYANFNRELIYGSYLLDQDTYVVFDTTDPKHVYIEMARTGYVIGQTDGKHQQHMIWSVADDYYNNIYGDWEKVDQEGVAGTFIENVITFPPYAVLCSVDFIDEPSNEKIWARNDTPYFRLKLPNALDLDVDVRLAVYEEDTNSVIYELTPQKDVTTVKLALVKGDYDIETCEKIANGEIESKDITEFGDVSVPYTEDGIFTLYAIPVVDGVAKPHFVSYLTRQFDFDQSVWKKCGYVTYVEGILSSNEMSKHGFYVSEFEYQVPIEQNVENPGKIRLVDAYGSFYPNATQTNYDYTRHYYVNIDVDDPDAVYLEHSVIGLDLSYGKHKIWSRAGRYYEQGLTKEEIREKEAKEGPLFGTHKDNEITFPKNSLLVEFPKAVTWPYWANEKGNWKVTLKEGQIAPSGVELVGEDFDATPRYFNMQGVEVAGRELTPGIYIVKRGSTTSKIVIR